MFGTNIWAVVVAAVSTIGVRSVILRVPAASQVHRPDPKTASSRPPIRRFLGLLGLGRGGDQSGLIGLCAAAAFNNKLKD